jgi:riboflavin kinase / FMN adenylyltransferase
MLVRYGLPGVPPEWPGSVVCIGTFDGVHLGHREVILHAIQRARASELPAVVVTFDRHPLATLAPERVPPLVGTLSLDLAEFERLGADAAVVLAFDRALADTPAEAFYEQVLRDRLAARSAVVGHDFAFGKGRRGTPEFLAERLPTEIVSPLLQDGERVSSSRIRKAVAAGDFAVANRLLGRTWEQEGVVIAGEKMGRTLGYPTVNLGFLGSQVSPPDGVYAGQAQTSAGEFRAAIGIGARPTFGQNPRTIEAFLLDYPGESLYGRAVILRYERRLREDRKFDTPEELREQMARDVAEAARAE